MNRRCDGAGQLAQSTRDSAQHQDRAAAEDVADGVHAYVDAQEAEAGVHDGEFKGLGDARDGEEVCLVSD